MRPTPPDHLPITQLKELGTTELLALDRPWVIYERIPDRKVAVLLSYAAYVQLCTALQTLDRVLITIHRTME